MRCNKFELESFILQWNFVSDVFSESKFGSGLKVKLKGKEVYCD
jgi:hypothetical protein